MLQPFFHAKSPQRGPDQVQVSRGFLRGSGRHSSSQRIALIGPRSWHCIVTGTSRLLFLILSISYTVGPYNLGFSN